MYTLRAFRRMQWESDAAGAVHGESRRRQGRAGRGAAEEFHCRKMIANRKSIGNSFNEKLIAPRELINWEFKWESIANRRLIMNLIGN